MGAVPITVVETDPCRVSPSSRLLLFPPLFGRRPLLWRTAGAAHGRAAFLDDVARVGAAVLLGLEPAPRVVLALERLRIGFLLRSAAAAPAQDAVEEPHRPRSLRVRSPP
jgi:hypothetical protein